VHSGVPPGDLQIGRALPLLGRTIMRRREAIVLLCGGGHELQARAAPPTSAPTTTPRADWCAAWLVLCPLCLYYCSASVPCPPLSSHCACATAVCRTVVAWLWVHQPSRGGSCRLVASLRVRAGRGRAGVPCSSASSEPRCGGACSDGSACALMGLHGL
jgi:hypothetical protein